MKTEAVAVVIIVLLLLGLVAYDIRSRHEKASVLACQGKMKSVGIAMLKYKEKYGRLPPQVYADPATGHRHSWRILLLEFIDHALFSRYDFGKAWDDPANLGLLRERNYFGCDPVGSNTNIVIVHGKSTVFSSEGRAQNVNWRLPSTVLMLVQIRDEGNCWLEPKDLDVDGLDGRARSIIGLIFLDGSYLKAGGKIDAVILRRLSEPTLELDLEVESLLK
jgi:hypothetical protein